MYYENCDLRNVVTPVNHRKLTAMLHEAGYDENDTHFLESGFRDGFDIGYSGPESRQSTAENIPFTTVGNETELWNKLMKEVKLK